MAKSKGLTIIGSNVQVKGTVASQGDLRVDGRLECDVDHEGLVVIGPDGVVIGQIRANTIQVAGEVRGTITAKDKLELLKGCRVFGDVRAPKLSIQEGARFEGRSFMGSEEDGAPDDVADAARKAAQEAVERAREQAAAAGIGRSDQEAPEGRR